MIRTARGGPRCGQPRPEAVEPEGSASRSAPRSSTPLAWEPGREEELTLQKMAACRRQIGSHRDDLAIGKSMIVAFAQSSNLKIGRWLNFVRELVVKFGRVCPALKLRRAGPRPGAIGEAVTARPRGRYALRPALSGSIGHMAIRPYNAPGGPAVAGRRTSLSVRARSQ